MHSLYSSVKKRAVVLFATALVAKIFYVDLRQATHPCGFSQAVPPPEMLFVDLLFHALQS
jgi:hypothetical protein